MRSRLVSTRLPQPPAAALEAAGSITSHAQGSRDKQRSELARLTGEKYGRTSRCSIGGAIMLARSMLGAVEGQSRQHGCRGHA